MIIDTKEPKKVIKVSDSEIVLSQVRKGDVLKIYDAQDRIIRGENKEPYFEAVDDATLEEGVFKVKVEPVKLRPIRQPGKLTYIS